MEALYECMSAVLRGQSQKVVDVLGAELIDSLLERCGLDEVHEHHLISPRIATLLRRTIASTSSKAIPTATC